MIGTAHKAILYDFGEVAGIIKPVAAGRNSTRARRTPHANKKDLLAEFQEHVQDQGIEIRWSRI